MCFKTVSVFSAGTVPCLKLFLVLSYCRYVNRNLWAETQHVNVHIAHAKWKSVFLHVQIYVVCPFNGNPGKMCNFTSCYPCAIYMYNTGPSCSKLTMSLVNESLKFTSSDTQICWNFLLKKMWVAFAATHIFSAKNSRILYIESTKTVNEMTLNELVNLTTLWTAGPRPLLSINIFCSIQWFCQ